MYRNAQSRPCPPWGPTISATTALGVPVVARETRSPDTDRMMAPHRVSRF
jgi:hypothetical protein